MPIYSYLCRTCGMRHEKIEKVSSKSWREESSVPVECPACNELDAYKEPSSFKIGTKVLETTGRSGYETDDLTLGKLIDEGGIPYEEKSRLRERDKLIARQNQYKKELKQRAEEYNFDPFSEREGPGSGLG